MGRESGCAAPSPYALGLERVEEVLGGLPLVTSDPHAVAPAGAGTGLWQVATDELSDLLRRVLSARNRLDAVLLAVVREADVRGLHAACGASSTAQWLTALARCEPVEARGLVAQAAALAPGLGGPAADAATFADAATAADPSAAGAPVRGEVVGTAVGAELAAGRLDRQRAGAVLRALDRLPHDTEHAVRCAAEEALAVHARHLTVRQIGRAGDRLAESLAAPRPDEDDPREAAQVAEAERVAARRAEERALEAYLQRSAWWHERRDGVVEGGFRLDAVSAAPVVALLDAAARQDGPPPERARCEQEAVGALDGSSGQGRMRGDGARAEDGHGSPPAEPAPPALPRPEAAPDEPPDRRTRAQRAADALSALCGAALGGQVDGYLLPSEATRHPQVLLTVDLHRLEAGLARAGTLDGLPAGQLSAGQVRALACAAGVLPVVTGGASLPLDVGRARRLATSAQRAALAVRDGGCTMPGCAVPAAGCIAHHLAGWAGGGPTDLANLGLLCPAHHTQVHLQGWRSALRADGVVTLTPPAWLDPDRRPLHHERHLAMAVATRTRSA
jgi:hypothetical protein